MARQRKRLAGIFLVSLVFIATFTLLSWTAKWPRETADHWYEKAVLGVLAPFQKCSSWFFHKIDHAFESYFFLVGVSEDNRQLRRENDRLQAQTILFEQLRQENESLRDWLDLAQMPRWSLKVSQVIGYNPKTPFQIITIDCGESCGFKKRMPVLSPQGLVGQIYRVGRQSAQVLLLTDPTSAVDARDVDTNARGLIRGRIVRIQWDRRYYMTAMEYIDRVGPLSAGDLVVTSGLDGYFPKGIPIGRIRDIVQDDLGMFYEATVAPMQDYMNLQNVLVITDW